MYTRFVPIFSINVFIFIFARNMLHLTKYLYMLEYILVSSKHLGTKLYDGITLMMSLSWDGSLVYKFMLLAIFSCFFFRELFRETVPAIAAACCFGFCFLYACSDEFHQAFVPGRVGQFSDVLIDMIGVLLGVISVCLVYFMKERKLYE